MSRVSYRESALRTIDLERQAIEELRTHLDATFDQACELLLACRGRVVVTGMGKSGHIGNKLAATLASTGTPSFFVHPGEASHGDMGMITADDVVIALSNSGNTAELVTLLPLLKRMGTPLISMTGNRDSLLSKAADVDLHVGVTQEACPLGLAPTSSTTATLVMGDALAIALLEARGFTAEDFAFSHPGGSLGRRLLLRVQDVMHVDQEVPQVRLGTSLPKTLLEMSAKGMGFTTIIDEQGQLCGLFTDGDLRRAIDHGVDVGQATIDQVMTANPRTISSDLLAAEALRIMEQRKISALVVTDGEQHPIGALHLHDLLRAGVA